ncbi:TetR/AcrR family transcriptional regulator [Streptosporangium sandarakinum]|uniref:TetR/AcrR family transcriptional regulator n=1 Tax=Streptosporangium TaxID=2000 RepID=UPI0031F93C6D
MKDGGVPSGDRRVRRTRAALARALLELAEERDLSRISVSDVAERAGVSRTAFYDHYRDVHELAEIACTAMIDDLIGFLPASGPDPEGEGPETLAAFFASLAGHAGLYRGLLGPRGSAHVADHVRRRLAAAVRDRLRRDAAGRPAGPAGPPEASHDVLAAFVAGALIGVAADWLQRECPQSPGRMADLTWPLLSALDPGGRGDAGVPA